MPGELSSVYFVIVCDNLSLTLSEGEAKEAPIVTVLRCFTGDLTGVINLSLFPLPLLLLIYIGLLLRLPLSEERIDKFSWLL